MCFPMNLEMIIPSDKPVRLLGAVTEELNQGRLTATYSRLGRIEYSPRLLFAVNKPTAPIDVWVAVWVKQNGPLKSGPKSSESKEKPLISCEISGDLVAGTGFEPTAFGL